MRNSLNLISQTLLFKSTQKLQTSKSRIIFLFVLLPFPFPLVDYLMGTLWNTHIIKCNIWWYVMALLLGFDLSAIVSIADSYRQKLDDYEYPHNNDAARSRWTHCAPSPHTQGDFTWLNTVDQYGSNNSIQIDSCRLQILHRPKVRLSTTFFLDILEFAL